MSGNTKGFFSGIWSGFWGRVKKVKKWVLGLKKETKEWGCAALVVWGVATLMGGGLKEAAFMAFCYCAAVWALLTEAPFFADLVIRAGLWADVLITFGATLAMPGTVSIAYAAMFFGIFFTCFRKAITPCMEGIIKAHAAKKEQRRVEKAEKAERKTIEAQEAELSGAEEPCLG